MGCHQPIARKHITRETLHCLVLHFPCAGAYWYTCSARCAPWMPKVKERSGISWLTCGCCGLRPRFSQEPGPRTRKTGFVALKLQGTSCRALNESSPVAVCLRFQLGQRAVLTRCHHEPVRQRSGSNCCEMDLDGYRWLGLFIEAS